MTIQYRPEQNVVVKGIGLAKIKDVLPDGTFWLFFASGKRGGGWHDYHFMGTVSDREFWTEWRNHRQ